MSLITIRPPQSVAEYHEACAMVERVYQEAGYLTKGAPFTHPGALLVAIKEGAIVGSSGLSSCDNELLPTEEIFGFNAPALLGMQSHTIYESQRLAITDRTDTLTLKALTAALFVHMRYVYSAQLLIMTIKPTLARVLRRHCYLEADCIPVELKPEATPPHPGYWSTDPFPRAVQISRQCMDAALPKLLLDLEGNVDIQLASFDHRKHYGREDTYTYHVPRRFSHQSSETEKKSKECELISV